MRTTREILIAVQEGGVAGVEEMRAALVALGAVNQLLWPSSSPEARERACRGMESDPSEWMRLRVTPGTREWEDWERASEGVARSHGFI